MGESAFPAVTLCGDRWQRISNGRDLCAAVIAPGAPVPLSDLRSWLLGGCRGNPPVKQGFVALALTRGVVRAAVSSRHEVDLFYARRRGGLFFAPDLRSLVTGLPSAPELDTDKLADLMVLHDDAETTVFASVRRLPLRHWQTWDEHGPLDGGTWFTAEVSPVDRRDAPHALHEAVRSAVASSLPGHGSVAATLSGGLDSSMVAATAAHLLAPAGRGVHAATHVPL